MAEPGPMHGATNRSATEQLLPNELTASNRPLAASQPTGFRISELIARQFDSHRRMAATMTRPSAGAHSPVRLARRCQAIDPLNELPVTVTVISR